MRGIGKINLRQKPRQNFARKTGNRDYKMQPVTSFNPAHLLHMTQGISKKFPEGSMRTYLFLFVQKEFIPNDSEEN